MAYLRELKNGSIQSTVRIKGINVFKTFPTKKAATAWAKETETNIKRISSMSQFDLANISEREIEKLGGLKLFEKMGIDFVAVRNLAKLEAINALTKKQALQLSPQEIESMGGAELFAMAEKRIRYMTFREVCGEYFESWDNAYSGRT